MHLKGEVKMLDILLSTLSYLHFDCGFILFLGASVGILRFPGFYTRMHAAGKADTLSSILILLGYSSMYSH